MKKAIPVFLLFVTAVGYSQQVATVTQISKKIYECKFGRPMILGHDAAFIYVKGNCDDGNNLGVFNSKTFEFTRGADGIDSLKKLKQKEGFIPYALPPFYEKKKKIKTMLVNKLNETAWGGGWHVLSMSEPLKNSPNDSLFIEFGVKGSTFTDRFGYNNDANGTYSVTSDVQLILGVAITRYDSSGKILWNTIFPRALFGGTQDPDLHGAPLVVQKNNYIYLFYIDRSLNYSTTYFHEIRRGDTFEGMAMKYDLICHRINPVDGTSEKFLIDSNPTNHGMYYLQDPVVLDDGSIALLRNYKNLSTFAWYKLQIP